MAITTNGSPERWDFLNLHFGGKWPPYSFAVVNQNDDPILGFTVKMQVRTLPSSSIVRKELTELDGFIVVGNVVTFDTAIDIVPGVYVYDIEVLLSGQTLPNTQYEGAVLVNRDVTKLT